MRGSTYISFWLPVGLYVPVLLLNERRAWPWLIPAAFAANLAFDLSHGTMRVTAVLFSCANMVEAVTGAWLVRRFIAERPALASLREFLGFLGFTAVLGNMAGAAIGAATLVAFGLSSSFLQSFRVWWGSDAMAYLLLSPLVLTWSSPPGAGRQRFPRRGRLLEAALLLLVLSGLTWKLLFVDQGIMSPDKGALVIPLLWAGLRFGIRGAAGASLLLSVPLAYFTTHDFTALTSEQVSSGIYVSVLQTSLAVAALVALIPAIVLGERDEKVRALRASEEHLRDLSRRMMDVEEAERRNINRELHDRVAQNLSALNLNLGIISRQLSEDSLQQVRVRLGNAQTLLQDTSNEVRNLMADLRPAALDDYGLLAALRHHAASVAERLAIAVTVEGEDPDPPLAPSTETALFRIAQEALNNVAKHARSGKVVMTLSSTSQSVILTVVDDGIGFDPGRLRQITPTYGLTTMRERAEAVGAMLRIASNPGMGTRVTVEVAKVGE